MNPPAIDVAQRFFNPFVGLRPFEESDSIRSSAFARSRKARRTCSSDGMGKATRSSTA